MLTDFCHIVLRISFKKYWCLKFCISVPFYCWTLCLEVWWVFHMGFQLFELFHNISIRFEDVTALLFEYCLKVVFDQLGDIFDNGVKWTNLETWCIRFNLTIETGPKRGKRGSEVGMTEKLFDKLVRYVHNRKEIFYWNYLCNFKTNCN
jgi:hypothetical protein